MNLRQIILQRAQATNQAWIYSEVDAPRSELCDAEYELADHPNWERRFDQILRESRPRIAQTVAEPPSLPALY